MQIDSFHDHYPIIFQCCSAEPVKGAVNKIEMRSGNTWMDQRTVHGGRCDNARQSSDSSIVVELPDLREVDGRRRHSYLNLNICIGI